MVFRLLAFSFGESFTVSLKESKRKKPKPPFLSEKRKLPRVEEGKVVAANRFLCFFFGFLCNPPLALR